MRVIKRRICSFAPTPCQDCKNLLSPVVAGSFFLFFFSVPRTRERTRVVHRCKWFGLCVWVPLIRLRPVRAPSKKVIIFIRTGKCLTKRIACYCSDDPRSDCCFVSLTRNVCRGLRLSVFEPSRRDVV